MNRPVHDSSRMPVKIVLKPLLALADYVKIDFRSETSATLVQQIDILKDFKVKLLAEKVETQEEFELAKELGFGYFQGYFFCRPKIVDAERIPVNKLATLRLVARLQDPDLSTKELETLISQDLALSFKLLRYINSAAVSLTCPIDSVAHAAQMVGTRRIRAWASTIMLTAVESQSRELTVTAMVRGTMAERLATTLKLSKPDACFTIGLFSVVDALLGIPMDKALELLPLSDEIRDALLYQRGSMGQILRCILAYENGSWSEARCGDLDAETISVCYLESLTDTRNLFDCLS
jgi:c-di-GMP-related signal transduction protein